MRGVRGAGGRGGGSGRDVDRQSPLTYSNYSAPATWAGDGCVVVVVVPSLVCVGAAEGDDDADELGEADDDRDDDGDGDGDGRTLDGTLELNTGALVLEDREVDVDGLNDVQVRCLSAIHSGAPCAIASSGQVNKYIEMPRSVCQRPPRNDTQYGSPE